MLKTHREVKLPCDKKNATVIFIIFIKRCCYCYATASFFIDFVKFQFNFFHPCINF